MIFKFQNTFLISNIWHTGTILQIKYVFNRKIDLIKHYLSHI